MKIAIAGSRGIPNQYGGFEQFAEYLSAGLADKGHDITVYSPHNHPYREKKWRNVNIIHCYDPEEKLKTAGQFIYDLNCILDARKRKFDAMLILGYTSSSVWGRLFPKNTVVFTNMDGLEWKRSKYSNPVQRFLKYAEKLAVRFSDYLIADSVAIQSYLKRTYGVDSTYIAYGAQIYNGGKQEILEALNLKAREYFLLMARMEPENNIAVILEGFHRSNSPKNMVVIGNTDNKFGRYVRNKFSEDPRIQFVGKIYDAEKLHVLKMFSGLYFHGHSVGGTNPSLLEAMASGALIAAHDNLFNRAILGDDAYFFSNAAEIRDLTEQFQRGSRENQMIFNNLEKIKNEFSWEIIISRYERLLIEGVNQKKV
jgi:glycosyltransferase involved in cell wall biosynthesis